MRENPTERNTSTELARERSREAAERTLMAWIRTALALIGFGFTVAKFYGYLEKAHLRQTLDPIHSHLLIGGSFIALGIFSLIAAIVQHRQVLLRIEREQYIYTESRSLPMVTSIILVVIGLFAFGAILL
jgi:putative membrane protein